MMKYRSSIFFIALGIFLSSCVINPNARVKKADIFAEKNHFTKKTIKAGKFWVTTYQKILDPKAPYVFYIEGDGVVSERVSGGYRIPSCNPTPISQLPLKLAIKDNRHKIPNVIYMAQPCQYTPFELNMECNIDYWTKKRMAPEVVYSLNSVIKEVSHSNPVQLIGYSGGGGLAVLIAARNHNVKSIVTISGNLSRKRFCEYHKVPLDAEYSLDPIDFADQVRKIPQLHLSGGKDKIVPPFIADEFITKSASGRVKQDIIVDATHDNNEWIKAWPSVLQDLPEILRK